MPHVRMEQLGFRPDPQHDAANYGVVGVLCALGATAEQGEQDGEDHSDAGDRPGGKVLDDTIMMNTGMEIQAEASASSGARRERASSAMPAASTMEPATAPSAPAVTAS